jgi:hypothetical protein
MYNSIRFEILFPKNSEAEDSQLPKKREGLTLLASLILHLIINAR